jgi:hypothetical protein
MFFVEMEEQDMLDGMTNAYWLQAWTAWVHSLPFFELAVFNDEEIGRREENGETE